VKWRRVTLPFGIIYTLTLLILSWNYSNTEGVKSSLLADIVMIAFPVYIGAISLVRTFTGGDESEEE
jgi:hypothetical protein